MSELTQEEFDRERERFIGMMVGQDAAEVWKAQAQKLAAQCDEQAAEIERLKAERLTLDQRIHNQRRQLRMNWETMEARAQYRRAWYPSKLLTSILNRVRS